MTAASARELTVIITTPTSSLHPSFPSTHFLFSVVRIELSTAHAASQPAPTNHYGRRTSTAPTGFIGERPTDYGYRPRILLHLGRSRIPQSLSPYADPLHSTLASGRRRARTAITSRPMPTAKKAKDRQPPDSETVDDASKRRPKPHQQLEQSQTTPARAAVAETMDYATSPSGRHPN